MEVLYVYWGAGAFATNKERIRRAVASIDLLFKISAAAVKSSTGVAGNRHVRWAMNAGCDLKITPVKMSDSVGDGIYSIKSSLLSRGIITNSRKYLAFVANGGCYGGIAELAGSSKKGSTNPSNSGGSLGMTYDCFDSFDPYAGYGANIAAHELMHTLGAVQDDAPHSTGGHCWDDLGEAHTGADIMCYNDGGVAASKFYARCPATYPETFDCGKDDYFNPYPPANSYLATKFNPADNKYLSTGEPPAWQTLPKPVVTFTKPSASGGAVGGSTLAAVKESGVPRHPDQEHRLDRQRRRDRQQRQHGDHARRRHVQDPRRRLRQWVRADHRRQGDGRGRHDRLRVDQGDRRESSTSGSPRPRRSRRLPARPPGPQPRPPLAAGP